MSQYILSIDQGTTSSRAILFNQEGEIVNSAQEEFTQYFPQPGWVEHDPMEILSSQLSVLKRVIETADISATQVSAIGITNQRETTIIWDKKTGKPIYNAIVWQDRRTSSYCDSLKENHTESIHRKTGLWIDAYFSGSKIKWILDHVEGARSRAERGELAFGTVDSWLIWNFTGGKHLTDVTNASRTMIFNIVDRKWDTALLDLMDIPPLILPEVKACNADFGIMKKEILGAGIPINGVAGDQHAALFGQMCIEPGMLKNTYGTGCFMVLNTGEEIIYSDNKLLTTIAYQLDDTIKYAIEGSVFIGGAVIQWLRDGLELISDAKESEALATSIDSSEGVVFVPALAGLGAPHWDQYARGTIIGLTRGTTKAHIVRAALESIALQVNDLIDAMQADLGKSLSELRVDGGAIYNDFLMQTQADLTDLEVVRPTINETTACGAAYLAGIGCGLWKDVHELKNKWKVEKTFTPQDSKDLEQLLGLWKEAVNRSKNWVKTE